jgi:hypothetical protein
MARPKGLKHTAAARRKMSQKNRAAWKRGRKTRWEGHVKDTAEQRREKWRRKKQRQADRAAEARARFPEKLDAVARDALNNGASILSESAMRRPTFVVITPTGRRIESLDPKIA